MADIISIRKLRKANDPDVFINCVLNDPARLARVKAKQAEAREQAKRKEEEEKIRAEANEAFQSFTLKLALAYSVVVTIAAVLVALLV